MQEKNFPFQQQVIQQRNSFSLSTTSHTAIKQFFRSNDKSYHNEIVFPFQ